MLYPSRSDRSGIGTLFYIGLDLYGILILAALTVFMFHTNNNTHLPPPAPDNVDYSDGDRSTILTVKLFDSICWIFQRLFNIFWYPQNLPLIPLAIDFNQSKTQKIIKSLNMDISFNQQKTAKSLIAYIKIFQKKRDAGCLKTRPILQWTMVDIDLIGLIQLN